MARIRIKRGTRAQLDAAKASSQLAVGEPYLITDENRIALGTAVNDYRAFSLQDETGQPGLVLNTTTTTTNRYVLDYDCGQPMVFLDGVAQYDFSHPTADTIVFNFAPETGQRLIVYAIIGNQGYSTQHSALLGRADAASHPADAITFAPYGMFTATTVQDVMEQAQDALLWRPKKNLLINGDFSIWQRGTSQTIAGYKSADRWYFDFNGGTASLGQNVIPPGSYEVLPDLDGSPLSAPVVTVSGQSAAGNMAYVLQRIEDVSKVSNRQVSVSFTCLGGSLPNVSVELIQVFGTTGSPSAMVVCPAQKMALTQGKISVPFDVPSIAGKTLTAGHALWVVLWFSAGSEYNSRLNNLGIQSGYAAFTDVQLEVGPVVTSFERRHIAEEMALCQRYFEIAYGTAVAGVMYAHQKWRVLKRTTPTITLISGGWGGGNIGLILNHGFRVGHTVAPTFAQDWGASGDAEL